MARQSETPKIMKAVVTARYVEKCGKAPTEAAELAAEAVAALHEHYRGDAVYFGVGRAELEEKRNWLIWEAFTGVNHAELARRFSGWNGLGMLTERQVYNIINAIRPAAIGKVQGNLFEESAED